jgi:hypothetical protein
MMMMESVMENNGNVHTHKIVDLYLYFIYVERGNNGGNQCLVAMGVV